MSVSEAPVITIDGPAGTGKGTVAKQIALQRDFHYLDSGALYRLLALNSQQHGINATDIPQLVSQCQDMQIRFEVLPDGEDIGVFLNQQEVSSQLRTEECAAIASQLAIIPEVRRALLSKQHAFRQLPGLVAEGRDMGTVVFPAAICKIFLTASAEERAKRRQNQLMKQGISASLDRLLDEIRTRDSRDEKRKVSPLVPAADAVLVDSTDLTIDQCVRRIEALVREALRSQN